MVIIMQMISRNLSIAKFYERRIAFTIPDWQRGEVWDLARQQWLIDSILRGLTLPKIYVAQNADGVFEVVDGQQRLAAIRLFLDGKISLSSVTMQELGIEGDGTFQSLSGEMAAAINAFTLQSDVITGADPEQVRELFLRLQHGMPLVTREKLNATHGNFRDYALALTKRTFFTVSVAFRDMRQAFLDVTSKVLATAVNGLKTSFRPRDMLALFEKHENFSVTSPLAQHIKATFEFCERAFPEKTEALRDRSYAQSVIMLASHLVANGKSDGQEASFARFVEAFNRERLDGAKITGGNKDWDYVEFRASSTSGTISDAVAVRHTIFLRTRS